MGDSLRERPKKIMAAMSGGVDSSAAAALLKEAGHEVAGITLRLHGCDEPRESRSCCGFGGPVKAREAAGALGIRHYVLDCVKDFEELVLRPCWEDYARGRTPNPCLLCNARVKFGLLLDYAEKLGFDYIATGHYAKIVFGPSGRPALLAGADKNKDQSYFLASLSERQLSKTLFPLAEMSKPATRAAAARFGLACAEAPESQDACLTAPGETFAGALRQRFDAEPRLGVVADGAGRILARHSGVHLFTVGQRKGIPGSGGSALWVKEIRPESGDVIVTRDEAELFSNSLEAEIIAGRGELSAGAAAGLSARVRYRQTPAPCRAVISENGLLRVTFAEPVRAVTPGQTVVLYDGDRVAGCGAILRALKTEEGM